MTNWIAKSTFTSLTLMAVTATTLLPGCGAAPEDAEATGSSKEAICMNFPCTILRPPPPPPPTCTWDALTTYPHGVNKLSIQQMTATTHCVSPLATDVVSSAELSYMSQGCSTPVYWTTVDVTHPLANFANAEMQLCKYNPDDDSMFTYMNTQLRDPYVSPTNPFDVNGAPQPVDPYCGGTANKPAHTNFSYSDSVVPAPPSGYFWAIVWMDPTCMGPCMTSAPDATGPLPIIQIPN